MIDKITHFPSFVIKTIPVVHCRKYSVFPLSKDTPLPFLRQLARNCNLSHTVAYLFLDENRCLRYDSAGKQTVLGNPDGTTLKLFSGDELIVHTPKWNGANDV